MLPNFDMRPIIAIAATGILAVAVVIVAAGWLVGRIFPRLRLVAPFGIAAFACWRAVLAFPGNHEAQGCFVVPWILSGAAVALYRALRGGPGSAVPRTSPPDAGPAAPAPEGSTSAPTSRWRTAIRAVAGSTPRILFIGSAAVYGALSLEPGHLAKGILGILAALLVVWTWGVDRRSPATARPRRTAAGRAAMGLALLALVVSTIPDPPVLEALPAEVASLHAWLAVRIAAALALLAGAAVLLAWEARRVRNVLVIEALVVMLSLAGVAGRALSPRLESLSRVERLAVTSVITFQPPAGWAEVARPLAPLRLYERNDGQESVIVAPLLDVGGGLGRWCDERGVAMAKVLASAMFEGSNIRPHQEGFFPCWFEADLEGGNVRRMARFGYRACRDEVLVFLHTWTKAWEDAPRAVAVGPGAGAFGGFEIADLIRCR